MAKGKGSKPVKIKPEITVTVDIRDANRLMYSFPLSIYPSETRRDFAYDLAATIYDCLYKIVPGANVWPGKTNADEKPNLRKESGKLPF